MAKNVKFVLDIQGWNALCKEDWMHETLNEIAGAVCSNKPGYNYRTHNGSFTALCNVFPETDEAYKDNMENNTLLKLVGG